MTYPVSEISGIGPDVADRLKLAGIRTTTRLLDLAKDRRSENAWPKRPASTKSAS
jgi:predicted flap endonuclease-1-like 5' DNA nuclease